MHAMENSRVVWLRLGGRDGYSHSLMLFNTSAPPSHLPSTTTVLDRKVFSSLAECLSSFPPPLWGSPLRTNITENQLKLIVEGWNGRPPPLSGPIGCHSLVKQLIAWVDSNTSMRMLAECHPHSRLVEAALQARETLEGLSLKHYAYYYAKDVALRMLWRYHIDEDVVLEVVNSATEHALDEDQLIWSHVCDTTVALRTMKFEDWLKS